MKASTQKFASTIHKKIRQKNGHFDEKSNQRSFLDELALVHNIRSTNDWYQISARFIQENGGTAIINRYGGSIARTLIAVYPERNWEIDKFPTVPTEVWDDPKYQRSFFEQLSKKLNYNKWEDWYKLNLVDVNNLRGRPPLKDANTIISSLMNAFPEHPWIIDRFNLNRTPKYHWNSLANQRAFLDELAIKFGIEDPDDWNDVSWEDFKYNGAASLLNEYNCSPKQALKNIYPEFNWIENSENEQLPNDLQKRQKHLCRIVSRRLFPTQTIHNNYLHPDMIYKATKKLMELDIYVPSLKLAFEYQGEMHYIDKIKFGEHRYRQKKDEEKREASKNVGITLITIPYWWNGNVDSLIATIRQNMPGLNCLPEVNAEPISSNKIFINK